MNEEQASRMIELLESVDWKLWEMYQMMKNVLASDEETTNDNN